MLITSRRVFLCPHCRRSISLLIPPPPSLPLRASFLSVCPSPSLSPTLSFSRWRSHLTARWWMVQYDLREVNTITLHVCLSSPTQPFAIKLSRKKSIIIQMTKQNVDNWFSNSFMRQKYQTFTGCRAFPAFLRFASLENECFWMSDCWPDNWRCDPGNPWRVM